MHAEVLALGVSNVLVDVGRALREGFSMFLETLWAIVLGFTLSGTVQAFVPRSAMRRQLGDHRAGALGRASLYGMVSSSCSYAAAAMSRSLFARGADFLAAMVFMFASTNLVIELGLVLLVLIGWQFVAAELVGGVVMIVVLVALGSLWLRGRVLAEAGARIAEVGGSTRGGAGSAGPQDRAEKVLEAGGWRRRVRSLGGWSDAASYTMGDLAMLGKEMAIGFVVAGVLTVFVPVHVWSDVFVRGHGAWTTLENVAVAPLVAVFSFVCSVGNVPLAAALWAGGIGFGGVVAFVFADLITLPLLLIYRKQYGSRMALRMLGVFWVAMSSAGLVTEEIFRAAGWVPAARPGVVAGGGTLQWGWATALDIVAVLALGIVYWLHRHRERFGAGARFATDPHCGMQVEVAVAPASVLRDGAPVYFCSERCADAFAAHGAARLEHRSP